MFLNSILFAITLSIDSIGIGITYGLKNTKILLSSKFILFCISFFFSVLSLMIGNLFSQFFSSNFIEYIGIFMLLFLGIFIILQELHSNKKNMRNKSQKFTKKHHFFIRSFGITSQIIHNPISSDFDHSNTIDYKEAFFLGIALSLDSFAGGIGFSTFGLNLFLFPLFVSISQFIFLSLGDFFGKKIKTICSIPSNIWSILSGFIFFFIAFFKLFF